MGIDHGRHGVGRVVEPIHELEAERDEQGDAQQKIGEPGGRVDTAVDDVAVDAVRDEEQADRQDTEEEDRRAHVESHIERGTTRGGRASSFSFEHDGPTSCNTGVRHDRLLRCVKRLAMLERYYRNAV